MRRRTILSILLACAVAVLILFAGLAVAVAYKLDELSVETARKCANWPARLANAEAYMQSADDRFFALGDAAMASFELGAIESAEAYSRELLEIAPRYEKNWNYGNAIHDAHTVLGRVALARGDVEKARSELLAAGATPGSPQLNSFGPKMVLARELLQRGERDVVLQYFRECDRFWEPGHYTLRFWSLQVRLHIPPFFLLNL